MNQLSKITSTLLFVFLTAVLVVVTFLSYNRVLQYSNSAEEMIHIHTIKSEIVEVLSDLKDAEVKQRGYLLTGDSVFIRSIDEQETNSKFASLGMLIRDSSQKENLKKLKTLVDERYVLLQKNVTLLKNINDITFTDSILLEGKIKMDEVKSLVLLMLQAEDKLLEERTLVKERTAHIAPIYLFILSLFAIIVISLFFFRLQKETNERISVTESNKLLQDANQKIEASEKLLSNILSQSLIAIAFFREPGMIVTFANEKMVKLLGKGKAILNKPLQEGVPELKNQMLPQLLDNVYNSGEPYEGFEIKVNLERDNIIGEAYFNFIFQPYRDTDGIINGVTVFATEITEQILAKNKIEESEERFNTLSESIPHMLWTAAPDGYKNFFNQYFLDYTGYTFEELEGNGWEKITFPADLERELAQWDHSIKTGEEFKLEKRVRHHNGTFHWHITRAIAQKNSDGVIIGWIGTSTEIDDQKKINELLAKTEEHFRTFANSIQNLAWIANGDGWIYWYNQRWYDYTGTTLEEMEGSGWEKVLHPDHVEKVVPIAKEGWKRNEAFELTFPLRRHDGEYRWFLTRAYPLLDNDGNIERWVGTNTDITEQKTFTEELELKVKERTKELQIQNQTFEVAEKIAMMGSYKWNTTTGAMEYSDNLFRLFDFEPGEFVPSIEKFLSFIHPDDLQEVRSNQGKSIEKGSLVEAPYRIISKNGTIKYFRSSGKFSDEGDDRMLIGAVQDISQDIAASKELTAKNLELENANAELASFNYIASHDLQEPLRKIQGFSKRIINEEAENLSDKGKDFFKRIDAAAQRMQNLILSLLSFSRTNTAETVFVETDLNQILIDVEGTLHELIKRKGAEIKSQQLPTISAVPEQMNQLFLNLISNSLKYSRPDVAPLIKISVEKANITEIEGQFDQNDLFWKISISDNGIGFEQQYEHKIFEMFQRLHGKSEYEGTGIGLVICKKIVLAHHGTISAIGNPGIGSTFTFILPDNH